MKHGYGCMVMYACVSASPSACLSTCHCLAYIKTQVGISTRISIINLEHMIMVIVI